MPSRTSRALSLRGEHHRSFLVTAWLPLALLATALGCSPEFSPPAGARIGCVAGSDCPEGWTCSTLLGRCVQVEDVTQSSPTLVGEPTLTPAILPRTGVASLAFTVQGALAGNPEVSVRLGERNVPLAFDPARTQGPNYVYSYAAAGDEPQNVDCPIAILLTGEAGVQSGPIFGKTVRFDFAPPALTRAEVTGSPTRLGAAVSLALESSEALQTDPVVRVVSGGWSATLAKDSASSSGNAYRFTRSALGPGTEPEGAAELRVDLVDLAGNRATDLPAGAATFDFTPPALAAEPSLRINTAAPGGTAARDGSQVTLTFLATEELGTDPVVTLGGLPMDRIQQAGLYIYTRTIERADWGSTPPATASISLSMRDLAGNVSGDLPGPTVRLDFDAPAVIAHTVPAGPFRSPVAPQTITFTTSEPLDASQVVVHLGSFGLASCPATAQPTTSFACTFEEAADLTRLPTDAPNPREGTKVVTVRLVDDAGNASSVDFPETTTFDFTPPSVASATAAPALAALGRTVVFTLNADEPLDPASPPQLAVAGLPDWACGGVSGNVITWSRVIDSGDSSGTYPSSVTGLCDLAGNCSQLAAGTPVVLDTVIPSISSSSITVSTGYPNARAGATVTAKFTASEPLGALPTGKLGLQAMSCAVDGTAPSYQCTRPIDGTDAEGTTSVVVTVRDPAGNLQAVDLGGVTVDRLPPSVSAASKSMTALAGAGSPLALLGQSFRVIPPSDSDVTAGTQVQVRFSTSEALDVDPTVDAVLGGTTLSLSKLPESSGTFYAYALTVAAAPNGPYDVRVLATDKAGNAATLWPFLAAFTVDTTPPASPDVNASDRIVYHREPWGRTPSASLSRFTLRGGPGALDADTDWVVVYDGPTPANASMIGYGLRKPDGGFDAFELSRADRAYVYVTGLDGAGNESGAVAVREVEWVATLGRKVAGSPIANPHRFASTSLLDPTSAQTTSYEHDGASLAAVDGATASLSGMPRWTGWAPSPTRPPELYGSAMAFDSARGRLVLFGGLDTSSRRPSDQTWEFDGYTWRQVCGVGTSCSAGPSARWGHGMVYDARRATVVLFGGGEGNPWMPDTASADTWEWDGLSWRQGSSAIGVPPGRFGQAMVYDPLRARVVLFGGSDETSFLYGDTWEYDGVEWQLRASSGPSPRVGSSAAWDKVKGGALLFGGCAASLNWGECEDGFALNDTWRWDGATWTVLNPVARPPVRAWHAMAFTPGRAGIVLFGGSSSVPPALNLFSDTWLWTGTNWSSLSFAVPPATVPTARQQPALAYDSARKVLTLHGGDVGSHDMDGDQGTDDTWRLDDFAGGLWSPCQPSSAALPSGRRDGAMAYDPLRHQMVLYGGAGAGTETWIWEGAGWRQLTPASSPGVRSGHAMAWHPGRNRIVLFGGSVASDTWEWTGTTWVQTVAGGPAQPAPREDAASAYDTSRNVLTLWGGLATTATAVSAAQVWEYSSAGVWTARTLLNPPSLRSGHTLAYAGTHLVLNGGATGPSWSPVLTPQTWSFTWDAGFSRWTAALLDSSGRYMARAVWEPTRKKMVRFGGWATSGLESNDTSEWDGEFWSTLSFAGRLEGNLPQPPARTFPAMAYDSDRKQIVLFGGDLGGGSYGNDTWLYDAGGSSAPASVMEVDFLSAGADSNPQLPTYALKKLGVSWVAGGAGFNDLSPAPGASLLLWDAGAWTAIGSNAAPLWAPAPVTMAAGWPLSSRTLIERALTGPAKTLTLAARTLHPNGAGPIPEGDPEFGTSVRTDYPEVQFDYRICPNPPAWSDGSQILTLPSVLPRSYSGTGNTCAACNRFTPSCAPSSTASEVLYRFHVPTSNPLGGTDWYFSATSTGFDTVLYLRKGLDDGTADLACNDESAPPGSNGSRVPMTSGTIKLEKGAYYYLVVDGGLDRCGAYTVNATFQATP